MFILLLYKGKFKSKEWKNEYFFITVSDWNCKGKNIKNKSNVKPEQNKNIS